MRSLVTGAAGFAGSHLTELLLRRGREVFGLTQAGQGLDNLRDALAGPAAARLTLIEGDVLDRSGLPAILKDVRPDEVYHLAALSSVRQSLEDPAATFGVNVHGTQALLDAVLASDCRPRILYVGSAEAYGESARTPRPLVEEDRLLPVTPYGTSKAAAERVVCRYGWERGLHLVRVRPFPHTGPRQSPQFVYPDLARQLAEIRAGVREPALDVGNLEVRRDLTDVRDMAAAYVLAVERGEPGAVYNLCSGRAWALREVLDLLIALGGVRVRVSVRQERLRPQDLEVLAGDATAFRQRTGWCPGLPLERTLADLLAYWQARQTGEALAG
ncbi:MAG: GDP-mannose 4,6-dehydratase [Candidatus Methylomirabilales bacterium]